MREFSVNPDMKSQKQNMEERKHYCPWVFSRNQAKFFLQTFSPMPLRKSLSSRNSQIFLMAITESTADTM